MYERFKEESFERVKSFKENEEINKAWETLHEIIAKEKYTYNFFWLGFPILQMPQDLQAMQEIIWEVKPDLIIETGIAHGGSLMFSASMLSILEACGEIENGQVIGIEINLYPENKDAIKKHPLSKKITIIEGSSTNEEVVKKVREMSKGKRVLICLDSNHTHDHVLKELKSYADLVAIGSYVIVEDTGIENLSNEATSNRPWGRGNNPMTAVFEFLNENDDFEIDEEIDSKLILTGFPKGYLRRIK